MPQKNA
ncbi:hypothetical protein D030_4187A, partial [Vibrio parahaemolyticus AQ3810]